MLTLKSESPPDVCDVCIVVLRSSLAGPFGVVCICNRVSSGSLSIIPASLSVSGQRRVGEGGRSHTGGIFRVSWHLCERFEIIMDSSVHFDGFAGEEQPDVAVQVDLPRFGTLKSASRTVLANSRRGKKTPKHSSLGKMAESGHT